MTNYKRHIIHFIMPFIGEFYLAKTYEEEEEAIAQFSDDDRYNCLIIIDLYNRIERYKEMCGTLELGYSVCWLTAESHPNIYSKTIFINESFNDLAENFILDHGGIVGFFRG